MATTSNRTVSISFSGDLVSNLSFAAAANSTSPGSITIFTLSAGNNTITLPTGGSAVKSATIIPPTGNTQTLTLKGVNGDTGIALHKLDPTVVSFDTTPPANFVLNAGGTITGLRVVWA